MRDSSARSSAFRPDIEGLRAIAVLLVLAFHADLPIMRGGYVGVDIFFVVSGFLITGILLRQAQTTQGISLVRFYARRAKRLLPAATAVLLACVALTWKLGPSTQRSVFGWDIVAAAAYLVNWRFADRSVDYLAEDIGPSPVLHFWSLSVEEQFYLFWPCLILLSAWLARRSGRSLPAVAGAVLSLVVAPSLLWSVLFTAESETEAFFVTTTRLWELGVGALLALVLPHLQRLPARRANTLAWLGIALIGLSAFGYDKTTAWPGHRALLPVLGAASIIAAGAGAQQSVLGSLLSARPMVFVGGLSYSIYLWHWPTLVVGQDWFGLKGAGWALTLIGLSLPPAWLSYRFIEHPIRYSESLLQHARRPLALGGALSLLTVACGSLLAAAWDDGQANPIGQGIHVAVHGNGLRLTPPTAGALALGETPERSKAGIPQHTYGSIVPQPATAPTDLPSGRDCHASATNPTPTWCDRGDPRGRLRIAVLGDSKIRQYIDALDWIGKANGWRLTVTTKSGCPFSEAGRLLRGKPYTSCNAFNAAAMKQLTVDPPDAVIVSQRTSAGYRLGTTSRPTERAMQDGLVAYWTRIDALGSKVLVLLDNPAPPSRVYECIAEHPTQADRCAFDREAGIDSSAAPTLRAAAKRVPNARVIDLTRYICPRTKCAPVIGGILVYRQGSHVTNTYALTMAPMLAEQIATALEGGGS